MKALKTIQNWYSEKTWEQLPYQQEVYREFLAGKSGLLNAPTGSGKTYAMWIPILTEWMNAHPDYKTKKGNGLKVIWITPLRALAKDITIALQRACDELNVAWRVQMRTGDTSTATKQKQKNEMPECLVTTPESIHILFAQKNYNELFKNLEVVVVDEWHELLGSKRGIQTELALSRLRQISKDDQGKTLRTWGISATIGNLDEAAEVLFGYVHKSVHKTRDIVQKSVHNLKVTKNEEANLLTEANSQNFAIIRSNLNKKIEVKTLLPRTVERFSWAGHLGTQLLKKTIPIIKNNTTTLIFTNVRSHTELWFQKFTELYPELVKDMAIHHGSLARQVRDKVEEDLHNNKLKAVICTSSLDLGVDFRPVDGVIQVGSPKGVARFVQRAGRAGHRPGEVSKIYFLPTNSLEIIESAALQEAIKQGKVEPRMPLTGSYDVLVQYAVTLAVSEGFTKLELYNEVTKTYAYKDLTMEEMDWVLEFVTKGGKSLGAYSQYRKVVEKDGLYKVDDKQIAMRHRMSIGTITGEEIMSIKMMSGRSMGNVEESFAARLKPGDVFWYAGTSLRFVKIREMTMWVQKAPPSKAITPRWWGGRISLTSYVADLIKKKLHEAQQGIYTGPEMQALKPLLELQKEYSKLPAQDEFLIETFKSREGFHIFFYPYAGRLAHEGLSALFAWRIAKTQPITFSMAMNDYGFELLSDKEVKIEQFLNDGLLSTENLEQDILASVNGSELAKRKFRDISRVSGLIFQGYPGKQKKSKHLQASSELLFDIFLKYDPDNLLIKQAFQEVLSQQLDSTRIASALQEMQKKRIIYTPILRPSPFAFPIMVDRLRQQLTTEQLEDRVIKLTMQLKKPRL